MKIPRQTKQKKYVVAIVVTLSVLLIAIGCFYLFQIGYFTESQPVDTNDSSSAEIEQELDYSEAEEEPAQENINYISEKSKTPQQYEGQTEDAMNANSIEYKNEQFRIPGEEE